MPRCHDCDLMIIPPAEVGGTGYAILKDGNDEFYLCYACCGKRDEQEMTDTGRLRGYLTKCHDGGYMFTNWPGTLHYKCCTHKQSTNNFGAPRVDAWFVRGGHYWHAVGVGSWSELALAKKTKQRINP